MTTHSPDRITAQEFRDVEHALAELGISKKTSARSQQLAACNESPHATR